MKNQDFSIFFGVPTLYGQYSVTVPMIAVRCRSDFDYAFQLAKLCLRRSGKEWEKRFGVPIIDGLGSTELLHIFLSNRPEDVRYGTTGRPVDGYKLRLLMKTIGCRSR
ncbi:MAG: hypothetical protein CM1200mP18_18200 [Gammaproteobacteria bacterium]|nr:MAG: hypothetical protein CM1200mP18_18200 [Gammaproteobacteria bacterium]